MKKQIVVFKTNRGEIWGEAALLDNPQAVVDWLASPRVKAFVEEFELEVEVVPALDVLEASAQIDHLMRSC